MERCSQCDCNDVLSAVFAKPSLGAPAGTSQIQYLAILFGVGTLLLRLWGGR